MLRITAVCSFGIGTSLILKMKIEKMLSQEGVKNFEVNISDLTSFSSLDTDIIFTSEEIGAQIHEDDIPKIIIKDFLNIDEIKEKGLDKIKELLN